MRSRRSLLRALVAVPAAFALLHGGAACDGDSGGVGGGGVDPFADVVFEGSATHAGLEALLAVDASENVDLAAYLTSPPDGEAQSAATPPTFRWQIGQTTAWNAPRSRAFGAPFELAPAGQQEAFGLLGAGRPLPSMRELFTLRSAHAAEAPMSGDGFLFLIKDNKGVDLYRVFTTALSHTPSAEAWAALAKDDGPFEACVIDAKFASDAIVKGGGPWDGPWIAFVIGP